MGMERTVEKGREAFRLHEWQNAFTEFSKADKEALLEPDDIELHAKAAYLTGRTLECCNLLARAHNGFLANKEDELAIRCAFWLGFILLNKGEMARGGGWISRAQRMLEEGRLECVEKGYLLLPMALRNLSEGDAKAAYDIFDRAGKISEKFHDRDLMALSTLGRGQALVRQKDKNGVAYLDEAMAAVESGEVSAIVAGIVYCAVIETCLEIYDLRRAQEWTEVLSNWCDAQPQMVPYKGQCLTRRSEIMQLHGAWQKAIEEAHRACELLTKPTGEAAAGAAFYQLGELYRMRGDYGKAEEAYRQANNWGRKPQPGLALLRLAEGQTEMAKASIVLAVEEAKNPKTRSRILPAYIDIMLAATKPEEARNATDELKEIAEELDAPILHAIAAYAEGAVFLKEGDSITALEKLRTAASLWEKIKIPYETARTRLLIGLACREIGDEDTAEMEFQAAQSVFTQLQAIPDKLKTDKLIRTGNLRKPHGLTSRERQVICLIANGKSNKEIANELYISERTVERHVSNIFSKLNVSSRSSATAYAFKHKLV
jgi:DNA-binding NarL/FixJ family response regulator